MKIYNKNSSENTWKNDDINIGMKAIMCIKYIISNEKKKKERN